MSTARKTIPIRRPNPADAVRELPQNLDFERALLGMLMLDAGRVPEVARIVRPSDFYRDAHATLFRVLIDAHREGRPTDALSVEEELRRLGRLDEVRGTGDLFDFANAVPHAANALYYANAVREKAASRQVILNAQQLVEEGFSNAYTADELRARGLASIAAVAPSSVMEARDFATLADAAKAIGDTRFLWPDWIAQAALNLLCARGGVGKTRLALDLCYRLYFALPWPDGRPNSMPAGTPSLWLFVDRNWAGAAETARKFGLPLEAIKLPTHRDRPLDTPELDDPATIAAIECQVEQQKPGLIVVDTITFATSRKTGQAEEAKAAFDGLMDLAARTGVAILALTHMNRDGQTLGRRIEERARIALHLTCPDRDSPSRLRFFVEKTEAKRPDPLGITLGDHGNAYDANPPTEPGAEKKQRGPAPSKSLGHAMWLIDQLRPVGTPVAIKSLVDRARVDGVLKAATAADPKPSISPLYAARDRVPQALPGHEIEELVTNEGSGKTLKYWQLAQVEETETPIF